MVAWNLSALRGPLFGLAAAASFGISAPLAKLLLGTVTPTLLAGLLYLGAAISLWSVRLVRGASAETPLRAEDVPILTAVVAAGGIAGPLLMLFGLRRLSAFTGSLLLNLEAPLTMLVAVVVFREHLGRRAALAAVCILLGAALLKLESGAVEVDGIGITLIAAACLCWAIDNNLTQRLSLRDPFAVVRIKATGAALANICIALTFVRAPLPSSSAIAAALALGSVSYGGSVVLDAYALRILGASREAAYFATAPFLGALVSFVLFRTSPRLVDAAGMLSMFVGVVLMLREDHSHPHVHAPMYHEHLHTHDEHHQHRHELGDPVGEPHAHAHRHDWLEHDHGHVPDLHHRHDHA